MNDNKDNTTYYFECPKGLNLRTEQVYIYISKKVDFNTRLVEITVDGVLKELPRYEGVNYSTKAIRRDFETLKELGYIILVKRGTKGVSSVYSVPKPSTLYNNSRGNYRAINRQSKRDNQAVCEDLNNNRGNYRAINGQLKRDNQAVCEDLGAIKGQLKGNSFNNNNNKKKYIKKNSEEFIELLTAYTDNEELRQSLIEYVSHRVDINSPMTIRSFNMLCNKLNKFTSLDTEKIEILNNSILNGWKGIFELKKDTETTKQPKEPIIFNQQEKKKYSREEIEKLRRERGII